MDFIILEGKGTLFIKKIIKINFMKNLFYKKYGTKNLEIKLKILVFRPFFSKKNFTFNILRNICLLKLFEEIGKVLFCASSYSTSHLQHLYKQISFH
jgi:hypothetical protein